MNRPSGIFSQLYLIDSSIWEQLYHTITNIYAKQMKHQLFSITSTVLTPSQTPRFAQCDVSDLTQDARRCLRAKQMVNKCCYHL